MADKRIDQLVAATTVGDDDLLVLQQNNQAKKLSGKKLGDYVYAAAAGKVAEVEQAVADAQAAIDNLESQKDTIAQAVADMADLGTDTTLTTAGMAADAEATGNKIKNLESDYLAQMEQGTGTPGSIVTFTDGADNAPLKKLIVDIEPKQDLHGQENPYPAGGGKNKLDDSSYTSLIAVSFANHIFTGTEAIGNATSAFVRTYLNGSTVNTYDVGKVKLVEGSRVSLTIPFDNTFDSFDVGYRLSSTNNCAVQFANNFPEGTYTVSFLVNTIPAVGTPGKFSYVQIEQGSTATAWAPYENICPITGYTGRTVYARGANIATVDELLPRYTTSANGITLSRSGGKFTFSGTATASGAKFFGSFPTYAQRVFNVKAGIKYTVSCKTTGNSTLQGNIYYHDGTNMTGWILVESVNAATGRLNATFIPRKDGRVAFLPRVTLTNGETYNGSIEDIQLVANSDLYENPKAYFGEVQGATIPITFPSEAGTVYGGTITYQNGKWELSVTRVKETKKWSDLTNSADLTNVTRKRFGLSSIPKYITAAASTDLMCNLTGVYGVGYNTDSVHMYIWTTEYAYVFLPIGTDGNIDVEMSYSLATPQTYTLTLDQVRTFLNINNVWADTGDIEELIYYKHTNASRITEDVQNAIEPMIAGVEETMTATTNYAVGDILIADHTLLEATAPIVTGETIAPDSNCVATTVSAQLDKLSAKIDEALTDLDGYYPGMTVGLADNLVSTTGAEDKVPYNFRTSGGAIDIGDRETETIVGGTIAWNQLVTTDTNVSKTKSGSVVSITDAVAENAQSLVVDITPQQDLHGYDHPWPAGGGKNLCPTPIAENVVYRNGGYMFTTAFDNGVITWTITGDASTYFMLKAFTITESHVGKTYTMSFSAAPAIATASVLRLWDGTDKTSLESRTATITSDMVGKDLCLSFYKNGEGTYIISNVQLEEGSTATDYEPYENICPIAGFDEVSIRNRGNNLLNYSTETAGKRLNNEGNLVNGTNYATSDYISIEPGKTIYGRYLLNSGSGYAICEYNSSKQFIRYQTAASGTGSSSKSYTLSANTYYIRCTYAKSHENDPAILLHGTAYESFTGDNTYDISWETEAGTVYGGTLNATTGKLVADRVNATLNTSSITWNAYGFYNITNVLTNIKSVGLAGLCYSDKLKQADSNSINAATTGNCFSVQAAFRIHIDGFTGNEGLAGVQALLGETIDVCYPIEEPIEYTLTPQQVTMLLGENNVWADTGSTSLTYLGTTNEITAKENHKYLTKINGTSTVVNGSGQTISAEKGRDNIFDLTQMFGTEIANHAYILEQTTSGTGVSWFNHLFPKPYYSYNAGELVSVNTSVHKMVGFNQWLNDNFIVTEDSGITKNADGSLTVTTASYQENKCKYPLVYTQTRWYFSFDCETTSSRYSDLAFTVRFKHESGADVVKRVYLGAVGTKQHVSIMSGNNQRAISVVFGNWAHSGTAKLTNICLNLSWDGERDGEYEEYEEHVYPLDSSLTLRGIPKLDSNDELYYDGDIYESDGTVTRKFGVHTFTGSETFGVTVLENFTQCAWADYNSIGVVGGVFISDRFEFRPYNQTKSVGVVYNSSTAVRMFFVLPLTVTTQAEAQEWFANNPTTIVYELATPITESANPYTNPQLVDDFGTEEYIDYAVSQGTREVAVPVGHDTIYVVNLRAKLEMAPDSPEENGDYIMRKTNDGNSYVPLTEVKELPNMPTINGNYSLKLTVANGTPTLTWVMA